MIPDNKRTEILDKFKAFFRDEIINNHRKNTLKLKRLQEFKINPFLWFYLAKYLTGDTSPVSIAKILIYPRVLGTSITTTFGTAMQKFISTVLEGFGSTTPGIDIEFVDQIDFTKKYCQLKSGPDSINRDDVTTIKNHFREARNRAKTNNLKISSDDFVFCTIYGERSEMNSFILELSRDYTVYMGKEFWYRLTGEEAFYNRLINAIIEIVDEMDMLSIVEKVIEDLSKEISSKVTTSNLNQSQTPKLQQSQDKTKIETVNKLRLFGLSDEQIAEALELNLDEVKQVDLED
ncbi:PmeII family type II restriction endonuclease [Floridanema evergladense]|uniref:PmeII family type II restriction endonuclease n=1 Tax=Floridaenema evergladense BLCC-F167 TaxID=3153639 RepID=A0ABV4WTC4_9CYAN